MKNTGIVRKIDELGRIVVPKEIRRVLNIKESDDLEIYIDNGKIVLNKFSSGINNKKETDIIINIFQEHYNCLFLVSDKEKIVSGDNYENTELPQEFIKLINERTTFVSEIENTFCFSGKPIKGYFLVNPIIINSDCIGLTIMIYNEKIQHFHKTIGDILVKLIENK